MGYLRTLLHGISIFPRPPKRGEGHFIASVPGGAPRTLDTPVSVSVSLYLASVGSTIPQVDCCTQVTDVVGRQRLRSATQQLSTSDAEHSLYTAPWSGTPCQTTSVHSRTTSPSDRVWKPGFSPDTSVLSAIETFVIIAQYKSTFTTPYYHTLAR